MGGLSGFPLALRYIPVIMFRRRNIITSATGRIGGPTGTGGVRMRTGGYITGNVSVNTGGRRCIVTKAVPIVTIGVIAFVNNRVFFELPI
jgi:hypothetical protein